MKTRLFKYQLPVVIVIFLAAFGINTLMVKTDSPVETQVTEENLQDVNVQPLEPVSIHIPVITQGIVEPRTKIKLLSEVSGKVQEVSPKWFNGGFFHKNDVLLGIDDDLYQNQLAKSRAALAQANSLLVQEQGFAYVAKQEWEKRKQDSDNSAAKSLALREPQLASIKAQYEAANADVVSAEKSLEKTKIKVPFDGIVANKVADMGQYISPGMALADIYAIDMVEIKVPLTEDQQAFIDLPALSESSKIPAVVTYDTQNGLRQWKGFLVRTEGVIDPLTKVLNGVVQVHDPYGLSHPVKSPLRLGAFVQVNLQGKELSNIFIIDRKLLAAGNKVWIVDAENKLRQREVKVLPIREDNVYVSEGLAAGEKLVALGALNLMDGKLINPVVIDNKKNGLKSNHE
jgi:RND family efflux transporter MFP subunit